MSSGYRLAPPLAARLVGLASVASAALLMVATLLTAVLNGPLWVLIVGGVLGVASVVTLAAATRALPVLRIDDEGYRVRWVRGAGVTAAHWRDVTGAAAASPGGIDCVVLRLRDGRTTSLPIDALGVDRKAFVAEIREHLKRGEGLRPL